jgi:uncharacterized protein (TIGR02452 family)
MTTQETNIEKIKQIIFKFSKYEREMASVVYQNPTFDVSHNNDTKPEIIFVKEYIGNYLKYYDVNNECILNFASAKHAGGGVLRGSVAQEEDICRNSLLYLELSKYDNYYNTGIFKGVDNYYTNFLIFSKNVATVSDDFELLNKNSYITSAAPNFSIDTNFDLNRYELIMRNRIKNVFAIAMMNGCKKLSIGAWGCGVFKNDPKLVSQYFKDTIDLYGGYFDKITFVIPDDINLNIFKEKING